MSDRSYLAWPFFAPEHRDFAAKVEAWAGSELHRIAPDEACHGPAMDDTARKLVRALGKEGFLRVTVPGEDGRMDVRAICLGRDILARHEGLADFAFAMQGLGSAGISLFGTPEQKNRWLPLVGRGEAIAAFAISEADAGSDVGAMTTTAVDDGDCYVLNGQKTWISNAGLADVYVTFARLGDVPGTKGIAAFVVEAGTPGFKVAQRIDVIAPHPLGVIEFHDCRIPKSALIGQPGEGFKVAMSVLDVFRSTVGAAALGFARRAMDEALDRSLKRRMFGSVQADFQLTQAKIADMAVAIDAAALLIYRAAWTKDTTGNRVTREASMAKLFATEQAQLVIDQAVQVFGGLGVISGMTVEKLYREIRALRIYEGASEVQKLVIAAKVYELHKAGEA